MDQIINNMRYTDTHVYFFTDKLRFQIFIKQDFTIRDITCSFPSKAL